jgi:pimeloyl-ACP methyl ester carboxylesterase
MLTPPTVRSKLINNSPPRLLINEIRQVRFSQEKFDSTCLNLHFHPDRGAGRLVLLVHGLGGGGYKTWRDLPMMLFDDVHGDAVDIAIFKYRSGHRAAHRWGADPETVANRLARLLGDLKLRYNEIYIVGHSLGGLVAASALQQYIGAAGRSQSDALTPVAALVFVASPRAGSPYARILRCLRFKEAPWLRSTGGPPLRIDGFLSTNIQRKPLAVADESEYLVPLYALLAERDLFVDAFSASVGIPMNQRLPLDLGHIRSAKPTAGDSAQSRWLHKIMREVSDVR